MKDTLEIRPPEVAETQEVRHPAESVASLERLLTAPVQVRPLFSDSILQYQGQKGRQAVATTFSFVFQCFIVAVLLFIPLYFTQELPKAQLLSFLTAPPPPPPPPPPAAQAAANAMKQIQSDLMSTGELRMPSRIPSKVQIIEEDEAPPAVAVGGVVGGVPGGIPGGQLGGVIGGIISSTSNLAIVPRLTQAVPQRVRISQGVTRGLLIHKVEPVYPPLARAGRIQGEVVLKAIIDKDGNIKDLQLVSGHPMLVPVAIEAVKEWHYRPFLLNGIPVEVETTITVVFSLNGQIG